MVRKLQVKTFACDYTVYGVTLTLAHVHILRLVGMTGIGMGANAAYYLDYQNRRPDYITAFVEELIDWDKVAERYAAAK